MIEEIIKIISDQLDVPENEIMLDSDITGVLGADSLDIVELVARFEERYGITITDEEIMEISTVFDIQKYIENHLNQTHILRKASE